MLNLCKIARIPLSLYIHFPWCLSKCPYCDFNSYVLHDRSYIDIYGQCLLRDLAEEVDQYSVCNVESIYFGGGTPSLMPPEVIAKILDMVQRKFICSPSIEITLEANPGTLNLALCQGFKASGINRMSLGVQSFSAEKLQSLQRIHTASCALDSIKMLQRAGFTNFNLDLMFGLPGQKVQDAIRDLRQALDCLPPHVSWYQLTLDAKSLANPCFSHLPTDEGLWDIQQYGHEFLVKAGYTQYEVAAYCRSLDRRCRHNLHYWHYGDYLGIGAGAHGKITLADYGVKRYVKISEPKLYLQAQDFVKSSEMVPRMQVPLEFMLNALRLYEPITYDLFQERTGCKIDTIKQQLQTAVEQGFMQTQDKTLITTEFGRNFLNNLLEIFVTEKEYAK